MPILKHKKKLYPENWDRIALLVKERAGWKCELCHAPHDEPHWHTGAVVVLTVHHINADPSDNRRINLIALCQRCHNRLDQPFRRKRRYCSTADLFEDPDTGLISMWDMG